MFLLLVAGRMMDSHGIKMMKYKTTPPPSPPNKTYYYARREDNESEYPFVYR